MGVVALVGVAFAASAVSAYVSYKSAKDQAAVGEAGEALKREQLASARSTAALNAREQESERQRKAGIARSAGIANSAAAGLDYWLSPSLQTAATENDRLVDADISSIRLLGAAQQRKYLIEERASQLSTSVYQAQGANAWIKPVLGLVQSGASLGMTAGAGGGGASGGSGNLFGGTMEASAGGATK